jgi:hypothetical protein
VLCLAEVIDRQVPDGVEVSRAEVPVENGCGDGCFPVLVSKPLQRDLGLVDAFGRLVEEHDIRGADLSAHATAEADQVIAEARQAHRVPPEDP